MNEDFLGGAWFFEPNELFNVIGFLKGNHPYLAQLETDLICEAFKRLWPKPEGKQDDPEWFGEPAMYEIDDNKIQILAQYIHDKSIFELAEMGLMEIQSEKGGVVTIRLTEKGRLEADKHKKRPD